MRRLPLRHLMLVAALVLTPAASAHAAAVYWTNAAGGNWNVASNWSTAALPTASDTAVFDLPGTYAVTMNVNVTLAGLRVNGAASGVQTLTATTRTITLNGPTTVGAQGVLSLSSCTVNGTGAITNEGALALGSSSVANALGNAGTLTVTGASSVAGAFANLAGATLSIQTVSSTSGTLTVASGFTNSGTIDLTTGAGVVGAVLTSALNLTTGTLTNAAGATIRSLTGSGANRSMSAALDNQGTLTVSHPISLGRASAVHSNVGTIDVTGGNLTVSLSGAGTSFSTSGTVNVATGRTLTFSGASAGGAGSPVNYNSGTFGGAGTIAFGNATLVLNASLASSMANPSFTSSTVSGTGTLFVSPGTTTNATSSTLSSPVTIEGTGTLALSSSTLSGSTSNLGTLALTTSTVSGPLDNLGTVTALGNSGSSGTFTSRAGSTLRVFSDLSQSSQFTFANGFTNNGTLELIALYGATGIRNTGLGLTAGTLVNAAGGVIRSLAGNGANARTITGPLDNQGTLDVQYALSVALNRTGSSNAGTIQLNGGDLTLTVSGTTPGFTNPGTLSIPTGRTLTLAGSVAGGTGQTFTHGGTASGGGTIALSNATLVLNAALGTSNATLALTQSILNGPATLTVQSGTAASATSSTLNAPVTVASGGTLTLVSSTLNGATTNLGTLTLQNSTQAATLDNQGTTVVEGTTASNAALTNALGATLRVQAFGASNTLLTFANGFTNGGTVELTAAAGVNSTRTSQISLTAGSFVNSAGAVLRSIAGGGASTRGLTGVLVNQGLLDIQYGTSLALARPGSSNGGTIQLTSADLSITLSGTTPGLTTSGAIVVPSGRTLSVTGSVAGGAGQNLTYAGGTFGGRGSVNLTNAALVVSAPWSADSTTFNLTTSQLNGASTLTVGGGCNVNLSSSTSNAPITVAAAGTVTYLNSTQTGALENLGTVVVEGTSSSGGAFTNRPSGTLRVQCNGSTNAQLTFPGSVTNEGTIELTAAPSVSTTRTSTLALTTGTLVNASTGVIRALAGGGALSRSLSTALDNQGLLDVQYPLSLARTGAAHSNSGTTSIAATRTLTVTGASLTNQPGGVLRGSGTLALAAGLPLTQNGIVRPGSSPGLLRVEGRVVHSASSVLEIEVAGDSATTGYDVLSLRDTVTFAGTLAVSVTSPYTPDPGRKYVVSRFTRRAGSTFATVTGLAYGPGQLWALTYSDTNLVLECVDQLWTRVHPDGTPPVARAGHTAVYDSTGDRMIVFGGRSDAGVLNDVWVLTKAVGFNHPAWVKLNPTGTPPAARTNATAVYDAASNRMVVYGGENGASPAAALGDAWVLTNANGLGGTPAWTPLTPAAVPPSRTVHAAAYDRVSNRMMVFGGRSLPGDCASSLGDVWVLAQANGLGGAPVWTGLVPTGAGPSARSHAGAAWDAPTGRLIVAGGDACGSADLGTWMLAYGNGLGGAAAWSALAPARLPATGWTLARYAYDAEFRWLDAFGGMVGGAYVDTAYTLSPADGSGATDWYGRNFYGTRPTPRGFHSMVLAPAQHTAIVFGGITASGRSREVWRRALDRAPVLDAGDTPPIAPPSRTAFALPPAPNPSAGKVRMAVDLARAQRLELSVFDVTGRRVAVIHDGILPAGRHSFEWGGASAGAAAPRPGVYLVRMSAIDRTQVARIVRVE
ncbi:MAG: kelch repeat-containing protein [bacterium]